MTCNTQATALVMGLLEGEDPKDFFRRLPARDKDRGVKRVAAYELEDIGIENCQYFQGRGTCYSDWDAVYTGVGDNPNEAIGDALDQAAENGWKIDNTALEAASWPYTPSVSDQLQAEAREAAEEQTDRSDYETDEDYSDAVTERAEEIASEVDSEIYYHAAVWLRQAVEGEDSFRGPQQEAEDPKDMLRRARAGPGAPSTWPEIPRWQKDTRWGTEDEHRNAFYTVTRRPFRRGPAGEIARDPQGMALFDPVEFRKILPHTRFYRSRKYNSHWVRYYDTNILHWDNRGTCRVCVYRYRTASTQERINRFLPHGWRIHSCQGRWYWFNSQWPENIRDRLWADQSARRKPLYPWWIPYGDDDTITSDGTLHYGDGDAGTALPDGRLKTPRDTTLCPVPVGPQTLPRLRPRHDRYGQDPNQLQFRLEGKYMRQLAHWKRIKAKHEKMKEVGKLQRELEKVDEPASGKKPKKGHQNIR